MPPRAVWKIRPSGVVPNRLMWARSSPTRTGGMGMVRVSLAAVLQAAFLAGGALVGPGPPGPRRRGRQDDPSPPGPGQVQVGLAEHDRLRRAQRRVVKGGEESLQVLSPLPQPPVGVQERLGVGGADDDPPVDGGRDGGGGPRIRSTGLEPRSLSSTA